MQQHPYGDAESLFRASQHDVFRVAYSLMRNKADAEDIAQESFCKLLTAWARRVAALETAADQRAYLSRRTGKSRRQTRSGPPGRPSASCRPAAAMSSACMPLATNTRK